MKYYLHQGLIIQIEYLKSSDTLAAAERLTDNWPWEADQYRNRIALYERDGWFRKLDEAVERNDKAATVEAIRKSFLMMTESMAVMRNAMLTKDTVGIDRKRTPLNSSHSQNSHALFCLKKKRPCARAVDSQIPSYIPIFVLYVTVRSGPGPVDDNRVLLACLYRNNAEITQMFASIDTHH